MTHVVGEPCFDCKYTDCVVVCPVDCFYQSEQLLYIHPDECIDCEACVPKCPVEAIFHEDNLPEKWKEYAGLLLSGSTLYGLATTASGGTADVGTVFRIGTAGYEVVHAFDGADGAYPHGSLIQTGSTLYGLTTVGGDSGGGTVFSHVVPEPSGLLLVAVAMWLVMAGCAKALRSGTR